MTKACRLARFCSFKIEQFLKLFIQRNANNQGQLCRRTKLSRFDGADGIAGNTNHFRQLTLRQSSCTPGFLQTIAQNQFVFNTTISTTKNTVISRKIIV